MLENINPELIAAINQQKAAIDNQIQYQLDVDDVIEWIEHRFRGDVANLATGRWEANESNRIMNEHGIRLCSSLLRTYLTRDVCLSIASEDDLLRLCLRAGLSIRELLFLRYREMDLNMEYLSYVFRILMTKIEMSLRRATARGGGGMTLESLGRVSTFIETHDRSKQRSDLDDKEKKKFLFFKGD